MGILAWLQEDRTSDGVSALKTNNSEGNAFSLWWAKIQFDRNARIAFYSKLGSFIDDGISPFDALLIFNKRFKANGNSLAPMTQSWLKSLRAGHSLSQAVRGWIPDIERSLIGAGEDSGDVGSAIQELINLAKDQEKLINNAKKNLIPVGFMLALLIGILAGFAFFLTPQLKDIMPENQWPMSAAIFFGVTDAVAGHIFEIVAGILSVGYIIAFSFTRLTGPIRSILDRFPPWSIYRDVQGATFLIVLSSLMISGRATKDALGSMAVFASPYLLSHIRQMQRSLILGLPDGSALDTGLFDKDTSGDIADYSKLSSFSAGIESIGRRASDQTSDRIDKVSAKVNILIKMLITFTVLGVMFSIVELVSEIS